MLIPTKFLLSPQSMSEVLETQNFGYAVSTVSHYFIICLILKLVYTFLKPIKV